MFMITTKINFRFPKMDSTWAILFLLALTNAALSIACIAYTHAVPGHHANLSHRWGEILTSEYGFETCRTWVQRITVLSAILSCIFFVWQLIKRTDRQLGLMNLLAGLVLVSLPTLAVWIFGIVTINDIAMY